MITLYCHTGNASRAPHSVLVDGERVLYEVRGRRHLPAPGRHPPGRPAPARAGYDRGRAGPGRRPAREFPHIAPDLTRVAERPAMQRVIAQEALSLPRV